MTWMVPPTEKPSSGGQVERSRPQMPWPAKAASPWMMMGRICSLAWVFADAGLTGAGAAHDDGVDGFEMAGVGGEVERDGLGRWRWCSRRWRPCGT